MPYPHLARIEAISGDDDGATLLPPDIHMVWLGSPLPERHTTGPTTFARLNPGQLVHVQPRHLAVTSLSVILLCDLPKEIFHRKSSLNMSIACGPDLFTLP